MATFVSFGEVLMRLSAPGANRLSQTVSMDMGFGGSEANVGAALAQWGISASHVTQLPEHELGMAAKQSLQQYGIHTDFVFFKQGRIGIYFLEHGVSMRSPKVIYDRYNSVFEYLEPADFNWDEILKDAHWFHWSGITPAISEKAAQACSDAIKVARKKNIIVSGDINYRRVLWRYGKSPVEIMPELISQSDWIIGGITDFENCLGLSLSSDNFEQACVAVQKNNSQIKHIATTQRTSFNASHNNLQGLLWNFKGVVTSKIYDIQPLVDRIGSGDAFMAGLVWGGLNLKEDGELIEFATAAAACKHSIAGDVLTAGVHEIESIIKNGSAGKLLR